MGGFGRLGIFQALSQIRDRQQDRATAQQASEEKRRLLEEALTDRKAARQSRTIEDVLHQAQADALKHPAPKAQEYETLDTPEGFVRVPRVGPTGVILGPNGQPYKKRVEPKDEPLEVVIGAGGKRYYARRSAAVGQNAPEPAPKEPPRPNEANTKAAGMLHRVIPAGQALNSFGDRKTLDAIAAKAGIFGNWASSPEGRRLKVAGDAWIYGVLRPESGATIGDKERETYNQTYLPQPGDDDDTLATKRENRRNAEEGVAIQAGPAYEKGQPRSAMEADSTANPSAFNRKYHGGSTDAAAAILLKHGIR